MAMDKILSWCFCVHDRGEFAAVYPPSPLHLHQDDQERRHAKPAESNLLSTQLSRPPDDRLIIFILIIRVIIRNRKASKKTLKNIFGMTIIIAGGRRTKFMAAMMLVAILRLKRITLQSSLSANPPIPTDELLSTI